MHVVQTPGVPPNQGRMALPSLNLKQQKGA